MGYLVDALVPRVSGMYVVRCTDSMHGQEG